MGLCEIAGVPPQRTAYVMAETGHVVTYGELEAGSNQGWALRLVARADAAIDEGNTLGVHPQASGGRDALDRGKPPSPPGRRVRVALLEPGTRGRRRELECDVRDAGAEGSAWEVELRSATPGEEVTLDLQAGTVLPEDLAVRLVDVEVGTVMDILVPGARSGSGSPVLASYPLLSRGPAPGR